MKAAIWDLDGTLLDSKPINFSIFQLIFPAQGLRAPSRQEFEENFHGTLDDTLRNLAKAQNVVLDEAAFIRLEHDYLENQNNADAFKNPQSVIFDDAMILAKRLHDNDWRQVIVTNRKHERRGLASPRAIVANTALSNCISDVICGDDTEFTKPDVQVLGELREQIKSAEQCLVIGDQYVDAQFARNLGTRAVLVTRNGKRDVPHINDNIPDWNSFCEIVGSLEEVIVDNDLGYKE